MNWRKIRIGDFLHRVRIPVDIEDDQQYNLVTIRMHHKGVALRASKPGREIGTKRMYKVQPGHFILSGIDARHGAFGIVPAELAGAVVTNDFWYFEVDEQQVDKALFLYLTSTSFFDDLCRIASDGTTNRVRLQADKFFNYEINLPPVREQRELVSRLQLLNAQVALVQEETEHQMLQLMLLRQALLREAMQGQMLPQDPTDEPAAVLLHQLQATAKPGKKGRGHASPLFAEEAEAVEGPFAIPASWVWRRGTDVASFIDPQPSHRTPPVSSDGIPYVAMGDISDSGIIDFAGARQVGKEILEEHQNRYSLREGDFIFGKIGTIGKPVFLPAPYNYTLSANLILIQAHEYVMLPKYLYYFLSSSIAEEHVLEQRSTMSYPVFGMKKAREMPVPLPPLAEQHRIVAKLEQLLQHCDALEQRIRESRRLAEQLLATALREALAPPKEVNNSIVEQKPSRQLTLF